MDGPDQVGLNRLVERTLRVRTTARYYTLGDIDQNTTEVWLVCHGYGQLAARFIRPFESIASAQRVIVAPEGLHRFYLDPVDGRAEDRRVGVTWMTREAREADIADYIAYLDQLCDTVLTTPSPKLTVLGFSQGVATAARWAAATDRRIDHLILWGAGLPPDLDWSRAAGRFAQMRLTIAAGDADPAFNQELLRRQVHLLKLRGLTAETQIYKGGHKLDAALLSQLAK
jgi:predicted esterase